MRRYVPAVLVAVLLGLAPAAQAYHGGGKVASTAEAPYSVLIRGDLGFFGFDCTGSIIDTTHVVTAAHCATGDDGAPLRPAQLRVIAGAVAPREVDAATTQQRRVRSLRVHPAYEASLEGYADVAVLEVDRPFTTTPNVAPVGMVAAYTPLDAGSVVRGYGFGQDRRRDEVSDEHFLDMSVISAGVCLDGIGGARCARSAVGTGCPGDSGGPIVTTAPTTLLAGVISGGTDNRCAKGETAWFADLSSPGIADFIHGNDHPPALPLGRAFGDLRLGSRGGALRCAGARWDHADVVTTAFLRDGAIVQSGPATTYTPTTADAGHTLACQTFALAAGGAAQLPAQGSARVATRGDGVRICVRRAGQTRCN